MQGPSMVPFDCLFGLLMVQSNVEGFSVVSKPNEFEGPRIPERHKTERQMTADGK